MCEWRAQLSKSASTGLDVGEVPGACARYLGLRFAGLMVTRVGATFAPGGTQHLHAAESCTLGSKPTKTWCEGRRAVEPLV